jgi:hypothetical protein
VSDRFFVRRYPSAIDADAFINDNIGAIESFSSPSIDGTLWEHYATNNTHILRDYQGDMQYETLLEVCTGISRNRFY